MRLKFTWRFDYNRDIDKVRTLNPDKSAYLKVLRQILPISHRIVANLLIFKKYTEINACKQISKEVTCAKKVFCNQLTNRQSSD